MKTKIWYVDKAGWVFKISDKKGNAIEKGSYETKESAEFAAKRNIKLLRTIAQL